MAKERPPLEEMTLRQLRKIASDFNIYRYSRKRKQELLSAIQQVMRQSNIQIEEEQTITKEEANVKPAKFELTLETSIKDTISSIELAENTQSLPGGYGESRIVLMPRDSQWTYAYWDIPNEHKQELRSQGGQTLILRLYDVTHIDFNSQVPHSVQEYLCDELAREWYLSVPVSNRDYIVEIGYRAFDGRWLVLARSLSVHVPPLYPSQWIEDVFVTVNWEEDLRDKTVYQLVSPQERYAVFTKSHSPENYQLSSPDVNVSDSLQYLPDNPREESTFSSYVLSPGVGSWALPTVSDNAVSSYASYPQTNVSGLSGSWSSGVGLYSESGVGLYSESGVGLYSESGVGLYSESGVGLYSASGVGFYSESGVGLYSESGVGLYSESGVGLYSASGVGLYSASGVGLYSASGVGLYSESGVGLYSASGVGLYSESGVGLYSASGVGLYSASGVGLYSASGVGLYSESGVGLYSESGVGLYSASGVGLYSSSGVGLYSESGVGLYSESGVGLYSSSGVGLYSESGVGLYSASGVGLYSSSGVGLYSESGVGLSGYSASGIGMSGIGMSGIGILPERPRKFWLVADAELIVYGATEPDATVTIGGRPIKLNEDGTFRFHLYFPDGLIDYPIMAVAVDGEQTRSIHLKFNRETTDRNTNTKEEAILEWI